MDYKDKGARRGYRLKIPATQYNPPRKVELWDEIRDISERLDLTVKMWCRANERGPKQITITAGVEPRNNPSLHPYGGAVDMRTKDWPDGLRRTVEQSLIFTRLKLDPKYKFLFEEKPKHLHIQYGTLSEAQDKGLPYVEDNI